MTASKSHVKFELSQQLRDQAFSLQHLADLIPDLLFIIDLDDRDIIYVNHRVEQMLGHPADHVYQQGHEIFKETLHPDDYDRMMTHLEQCKHLSEEQEKLIEVRMKTADGSWSWFKIRDKVYKRDAEGSVIQTIGIAQFIQDQVSVREAKYAKEALLRQAEQVGNFGSYEADVKTMELQLSDGFYRLFGYEPQGFEPSLAFIDSVSHPDDAAAVSKVLQRAVIKKQPYEYRRRIFLPNGKTRFLCSKGKVVCGPQGEAVKLVGIVEDITDQVRTDLILKTINEVCFELDKSFNFIYANRRAFEVWEKKEQQVIGKNIREVLSSETHASLIEVLSEALIHKTQLLREVYSPNDQKWIIVNASPSPAGLIVLYFDVSEQYKAREEAIEYQEQLKTLVENIPSVVSRWDRHLKLLFANTALEVVTGAPNAHLYGKTILEMNQDTEIARKWIRHLKKVLSTGKAVNDYYAIPLQKGVRNFYSSFIPEKDSAGNVQSILAISQDITEQMKTQHELMEAQKLSIKGKLARTIAHEVRGPLVNINLSLELLQNESGNSSNSVKDQPYFSIIATSCRRIDTFITELLNISKAEAKAFVPTELADLVETALLQAQDRLFLKSIEIERQFNGPCVIMADRERLKIALLNIIHNAIEAMEAKQGLLQLIIHSENSQIVLVVQDNGCGMTEEQRSRMFETYFTSKPSGLGVGLANVKKILEDHQCRIEVKSEPGAGTAFKILFNKVEQPI